MEQHSLGLDGEMFGVQSLVSFWLSLSTLNHGPAATSMTLCFDPSQRA